MVNFGFNSASILGIFLALSGAGLYLMRSLRPEISRDHDIFFAAVGLLCGGILLWHGWRLDPILQFSQLLLSSTAIFFAVESIRLRGATTVNREKGRSRGNSYVEEDRTVSRVYRAELEETEDNGYDDYEEEIPRRRLQGTAVKSPRRQTYEEEAPRNRRPRRPSGDDYPQPASPSNPRRPRPATPRREDYNDVSDQWYDDGPNLRKNYPPANSSPSGRNPKRRPKSPRDIASSVGTEYVDYQPIEPSDNQDNYPEGDRTNDPNNFEY